MSDSPSSSCCRFVRVDCLNDSCCFVFFFISSFVSFIYFSISSLLNGLKEGKRRNSSSFRTLNDTQLRPSQVCLVHETAFLFNISFITFLMLIYIRGVYLVPFRFPTLPYNAISLLEVKINVFYGMIFSTLCCFYFSRQFFTDGKSILFQWTERRFDEWPLMNLHQYSRNLI